MRRSALGGDSQHLIDSLTDVAPDLGRFVTEFAYGDIYCRTGLEFPERQLLAIAAFTVLGDSAAQLGLHIRGAIEVGVSPETVVEAILQTIGFAGFPRAINAIHVAGAVFDERGLLPAQ